MANKNTFKPFSVGKVNLVELQKKIHLDGNSRSFGFNPIQVAKDTMKKMARKSASGSVN